MAGETDLNLTLSADIEGSCLYAAVRRAASDRPALTRKRARCNGARWVVLKLKTPSRGSTTHLVTLAQELCRA